MNRLEVVFATDGRGVKFAHVAIVSLLRATSPHVPIRISVLVSNATKDETDVLVGAAAHYPNADVNIVESTGAIERHKDVLCQEKLLQRWPMAVWARCFVDVLLPDVTGNLLYLDTDVVVVDDISSILNVNLDGSVFAAFPETTREYCTGPDGKFLRLGLGDEYEFYFNSGVMVFNMSEYRRLGGSEKIVELVRAYEDRIVDPDQDVLNLFAEGRVKALAPRWNYNDGWLDKQFAMRLGGRKYRGRVPLEVLQAILNPGIIHYKGCKHKPWKANHRPERLRYEGFMRELGYLNTRYLPDMTPSKYVVMKLYDLHHFFMRQIVKLRLFLYSRSRPSR